MTFKSMKYCLLLIFSIMSFTLFPTENSIDFDSENASELTRFIDALEKNPDGIKKEDFKKITPLALAAAQSNTPFIKQSGLWLLQASIRLDTHFNQFDQALKIVRKAMKSSDVQMRCLGIAVLRKIVNRYTKIDEIKEEALRITHAAIKRGHEQEQSESFALYVDIINRDKEFSQFNNLAQAIDEAMQSRNKDIQASGIWLLFKHVKRNPRFDAFKKAHVVAKTGMASSHKGMRCHTAALLSALIHKEPRFSELPTVHRFAIAEVRRAMAAKPMAIRKTSSASFTNSIALLSDLVDRGINFQKQEYDTIQEAALQCIELFVPVDAKAWANSLNMLAKLVERRMTTAPVDQLTEIALHATESSIPRVLSGGLRLLRTIILLEAAFVQFEAAEQAALRYVEHDNTWVRRYAHEVLIALLQKDKLKNRSTLEHAVNRIEHSGNDEKRQASAPLLNVVASTKHQNIFLVLGITLIFLFLCYLVCSWSLDWIRNRRLHAIRKLGNEGWVDVIPESQDVMPENQIDKCVDLVQEIFGQDLLAVYLYGSSVVGGLQKYSDIDLFVVTARSTTREEKASLVATLLNISGIYMESKERPIEMTIVEKSAINPWRYPPTFDFQYGEWLREQFEAGNIEPWSSKEMPDLALLITQVLLASKTLVGTDPDQLLCKVPYKDFIAAITDALPNLIAEFNSDIRNVLLTLARIWSTLETDTIRSKPAAATWAINHLPATYRPVMERAKAIYNGEEEEYWEDIHKLISPCANFMINKANKIVNVMTSNDVNRSIKIV